MAAGWRYFRAADVTNYGVGTVDETILFFPNGTGQNLFIRTDDNPTAQSPNDSGADGGSGKLFQRIVNQTFFFEAGTYGLVDINFHGVDPGGAPLIITNIGGQAVFLNLNLNGLQNAKVTGKYVAGVSGDASNLGHDRSDGVWGKKGTYGIEIANTNYSAQGLVYLRDQYGTFRKTCSDIETEYVEVWGGVTGIQMKADFLNDDGYDDDRNEQTYDDYPTNSVKSSGTMWNMIVHDCYFHDISGESLYAGHTGATSSEHHSIHLRYYNNVVARCGREMIQAGRLIPNMTKYAVDVDDSVSEWKSKIYNNVLLIGAFNWLRVNPDGAANNQDGGFQIQCRNGGIEVSDNVIMGGGEFTVFIQQDLGGGLTSGVYAQMTDSEDEDTWVILRNNFFGNPRNSYFYCQSSLSTSDRYCLVEDNFFDSFTFDYDSFYGDAEPSYYITGNDDDTYFTFRDNTKKDAAKTFIGAFSPASSRITESGTTTDAAMALMAFTDSGWDDSTKEYARYEHWVDEIGRKNGDGGGTQPGSERDILIGDILTVNDQTYYQAKSSHGSNTADSEPGTGASWGTYFTQLTSSYFPDDLRLPSGNAYEVLGMGVGSSGNSVSETADSLAGISNRGMTASEWIMQFIIGFGGGSSGGGSPSYDAALALNLKNFGVDIGGNWNEPDVDYSGLNSVSADLTEFLGGSASGISCTITNAATSGDTSGDGVSTTTTFPAGTYQRGARCDANVTLQLTFAGFSANAAVQVYAGFFVTASVYVTEDGLWSIQSGDTTAFNCTAAAESVITGTADGSGNLTVEMLANNVVNNGVGMCGLYINYVA